MKRPNGYGSIIYLGKKRRRPWAIRITDLAASIANTENGQRKRKFKYIGYYPTKADAYAALELFNNDKPSIDYIGITFKEIWDIWAERNLDTGSESRKAAYTAAIKKCAPLYNKKITALRLNDLQNVVDKYEGGSLSGLTQLKTVIGFVFEWAIKNDVIEKDYSKFIEIRPRKTVNHKPLTHNQFDSINAVLDPTDAQKMILIYLYTGCRPAELINLKKDDVHLDEKYLHIRQAKTAAGVRLVPIADKIYPYVKYFYDTNKEKLFDTTKNLYFKNFVENFPDNTPHDTRSTFISFLTEKDVPLIIIQKIVGHKSGNVTNDVYTKLSLQPLLDAVNKL